MPDKDKAVESAPGELELLRRLRSNPIMGDNMELMMEKIEQEIANGSDAEEAVIEMLQNLGRNIMTRWGEHVPHDQKIKARQDNPSLKKHAKKTPLANHLRNRRPKRADPT